MFPPQRSVFFEHGHFTMVFQERNSKILTLTEMKCILVHQDETRK